MNKRSSKTPTPSPHRMRVKRAIMSIRTPTMAMPSWKVFDNHLYDGKAKASSKQPPASARKLAATIWNLQDLPLPACLPACLNSPNWGTQAYQTGVTDSPFSQPDYVFTPETVKTSKPRPGKQNGTNGSLQSLLQKSGLEPDDKTARSSTPVDRERHIPCHSFTNPWKGEGEDVLNVTSTMSQELLRVFNQIRLLEEQHNSSLHLTSTLQTELMEANARLKELEHPHKLARREARRDAQREVEELTRKFSNEKMAWKAKEDKFKAMIQSMKTELDDERTARQKVESNNHKLTKELIEAKAATETALLELESERQSRQHIEAMCNDLAHENEDDKAVVEEMKRESQRVREALEEERRMLQITDGWREQSVRMRFSEAKLALEEKSAALDHMRIQLESFLRATQNGNTATLRDAQVLHNVITTFHHNHSLFSFPPSPECMDDAALEGDPSQEKREHERDMFYYRECT